MTYMLYREYMYNMYIHLSGHRVCHFCNKSSSTRYRTGFNLAYVLEAAKLIIVETWEEGAGLARAGKGCSSVLCLGGGRLESLGGRGTLPPCAPHRQWRCMCREKRSKQIHPYL